MGKPGFSAYALSLLLHAVVVALLTMSFSLQQANRPRVPPPVTALQATVVDQGMIRAELEKLEQAAQRDAEQRQQQAQRLQQQRELEEQRLEELRRQRERMEQQAIAERERQQALEQQQREQQRQEQEQRERQAAAEEQRRRQAELEEQHRKEAAAAAERQRQAEAQRQRERQEAQKKAELEEQLRRALAEESARYEAEDAGLLDEYIALITQRIVRNWIQPPGVGAGLKCELIVTQIPGGEVTDVNIVSCNGDAAVIRSVEAAVYKASPLPPPPDPRLFERKIRVFFEPGN